jgi:predicted phage terminase large subunit-like protein
MIIMQRLHEDDLVGHVRERPGWKLLSFPATAEKNEKFMIQTPYGKRTFIRKQDDLLHPERESAETLQQIKATLGEYNYAGQYQQAPAPLEGGLVKRSWLKYYEQTALPKKFDQILVSWDTANKPTELNDFSVATVWGIRKKKIYLLDVYRKQVNYPDLKRAVVQMAQTHKATVVLIEDAASGTQLVQELVYDGMRIVKAIKPEGDKVMRFNAQTATIENGFVYLPKDAPWLPEYVSEITTFPNSKHKDQSDSTAQALAWINQTEPESWVENNMRHEIAIGMNERNVPLDEIAQAVDEPREEVQDWFNQHAKRQSELVLERYASMLPKTFCDYCHQQIVIGTPAVKSGSRAYHPECLRKFSTGM